MNTNFKNFPAAAEIDAHGVDCLNYKGDVRFNTRTYSAARYYAAMSDAENTKKVQDHVALRREHDRIVKENAFKLRAYEDTLRMWEDIATHNRNHPDNPIPQIHKPIMPKLKEVPELKKSPRLASIPTLRWYEVGKAPMTNTEVEA